MTRQRRIIGAILVVIAAAALALPLFVVTHPPAIPARLPITHPVRVVPRAVVPPVEPVAYRDVAPEDAVAYNADVPFSTAPNLPARPFVFNGGMEDRARARDCLAAAEWYEAGDDATGEKAVAQVVLNRVRHPAFPNTVCGVVFQGAERHTGCQFTFTCDGALSRMPSPAAWERARDIATKAIAGTVYRPVGTATHYHTNWVVPYWSSSLDKIVEVHTHLFFRWTGWWGTPPAFRIRQGGAEPAIALIARLSPAHAGSVSADEAMMAEGATLATNGMAANPVKGDANTFIAQLDPAQPREMYRVLALATCGDRPQCKFMGWTNRYLAPAMLPLAPAQIAAMTFSYLRDRPAGFERALWNCTQVRDVPPAGCMRRQQVLSAVPVAPAPIPTVAVPPSSSDALDGVRRRADAVPAPGATSTPRPGAAAAPRGAAVTRPRTAPAPAPSPSPRPPRSAGAATPPPA